MYSQLSSNFGEMSENWQGVDVSVNARLRNGLTVQGGTSTGARASRTTARSGRRCPRPTPGTSTTRVQTTRVTTTAASLPTSDCRILCRVVEPFLTSFRGLATYIVPKVDVKVSGTWRSDPGDELRADYVVTNAIALPSLGRNLSSGNVTVNLVEPEARSTGLASTTSTCGSRRSSASAGRARSSAWTSTTC